MTIAHTQGFWMSRAVIGTGRASGEGGASGIARGFYLRTLATLDALLAQLVEVQRRKAPGIAPPLLRRAGGRRPAARALVDHPDRQRARRRRSREQQRPFRCRRSPRQRFDLSVQ